MTAQEYLNELNEMYGTDIQLPEGFDEDCSEEVMARMLCGESFDSAMQSTF